MCTGAPFNNENERRTIVRLKSFGVASLLLTPALAFAGTAYQIQLPMPGLVPATEAPSVSPDLKFYVDYDQSGSSSGITEQVSGQSYPAPTGSIVSVSITVNDALYASFPATSGDALSGTFYVFKINEWQSRDLYRVRSLKISGLSVDE
jgi:hypothetical protein